MCRRVPNSPSTSQKSRRRAFSACLKVRRVVISPMKSAQSSFAATMSSGRAETAWGCGSWASPSSPSQLQRHVGRVVRGSIQIPGDGLAIVLLAEHQTTGGYPKMGAVISADRPALGRSAPGRKSASIGSCSRRRRPPVGRFRLSLTDCRRRSRRSKQQLFSICRAGPTRRNEPHQRSDWCARLDGLAASRPLPASPALGIPA